MNNVCPVCGTGYAVTSRDVGRRISCKSCKSPLVVTERGLERDRDLDDPSTLGSMRQERNRIRAGREPGFFGRIDFSTYLFGLGAALVIVFLFFPLIDRARVSWRSADIEVGEIELADELEIEKDAARKKKLEDDWLKEKQRRERKLRWTKISQSQSDWWNRNGMMIGFLLLAFGSLSFLSPRHPPIKRVVGAIVLSSMLILIFIVFAVAGGSAGPLK